MSAIPYFYKWAVSQGIDRQNEYLRSRLTWIRESISCNDESWWWMCVSSAIMRLSTSCQGTDISFSIKALITITYFKLRAPKAQQLPQPLRQTHRQTHRQYYGHGPGSHKNAEVARLPLPYEESGRSLIYSTCGFSIHHQSNRSNWGGRAHLLPRTGE